MDLFLKQGPGIGGSRLRASRIQGRYEGAVSAIAICLFPLLVYIASHSGVLFESEHFWSVHLLWSVPTVFICALPGHPIQQNSQICVCRWFMVVGRRRMDDSLHPKLYPCRCRKRRIGVFRRTRHSPFLWNVHSTHLSLHLDRRLDISLSQRSHLRRSYQRQTFLCRFDSLFS